MWRLVFWVFVFSPALAAGQFALKAAISGAHQAGGASENSGDLAAAFTALPDVFQRAFEAFSANQDAMAALAMLSPLAFVILLYAAAGVAAFVIMMILPRQLAGLAALAATIGGTWYVLQLEALQEPVLQYVSVPLMYAPAVIAVVFNMWVRSSIRDNRVV